MSQGNNKDFLGRGWNFPPAFDRLTGNTTMVAGNEDIQQSLQILLATQLGERAMRADYGSGLKKLLFEPLSTTMETYILDLVETAILKYEPRITIEKTELVQEDPWEGRIDLRLEYAIVATNTRHNFVYPFYHTEGTHLTI